MYKILSIGIVLCCIACHKNKAPIERTTKTVTTTDTTLQITPQPSIDTTPIEKELVVKDTIIPVATPSATEIPASPILPIAEKKEEIETPLKNIPLDTTTTVAVATTPPKAIPSKKKMTTEVFDHTLWHTLLQKHVSKTGVVNYSGFQKERAVLQSYQKALSTTMPTATWSKEDKLAYWMNVYNAFTVQLIINHYPIQSIKDIKKPWDMRFFTLGGKSYNLNEVEHKILRKMGDPRIHFGINCASFSCPPLLNKAFTASNVHHELEQLAINFINDPLRNTITPDKIELSKIFSWFAKDFKTKGTIIDFLNQYTKTKINATAKKSFRTYNWKLNE